MKTQVSTHLPATGLELALEPLDLALSGDPQRSAQSIWSPPHVPRLLGNHQGSACGVGKPILQYHTGPVAREPGRHHSSLHPSKSPRTGKGPVFTLAPDLVIIISVGSCSFSYTNEAFVPSTHQLPESPDTH